MVLRVGRLLIHLAGARLTILDHAPADRSRFISLGAAILACSAVAAISMALALGELGINLALAVPTALIWGLIVVGIYRWLITSFPINGERRWTITLPRIALTILIGSIAATFIVLFIFRRQIVAELSIMHTHRPYGLLPQLRALNEVGSRNPAIKIARWLLFALLVLIEVFPVVLKMLQPRGNYERILAAAAEQELRNAYRSLRMQEMGYVRSDAARAAFTDSLAGSPDDPPNISLEDIFLRLGPPPEGRGAGHSHENDGGADR